VNQGRYPKVSRQKESGQIKSGKIRKTGIQTPTMAGLDPAIQLVAPKLDDRQARGEEIVRNPHAELAEA
jgi:hypothetical protein